MGPLELADFIGLDTCLAVMQVLYEGRATAISPCPLLVKYVEAGWWPQDRPRLLRLQRTAGADAVGLILIAVKFRAPGVVPFSLVARMDSIEYPIGAGIQVARQHKPTWRDMFPDGIRGCCCFGVS